MYFHKDGHRPFFSVVLFIKCSLICSVSYLWRVMCLSHTHTGNWTQRCREQGEIENDDSLWQPPKKGQAERKRSSHL